MYSYESGDGTKAEQDGVLKQIDPENAGESVKGSYSYVVIIHFYLKLLFIDLTYSQKTKKKSRCRLIK